MDAIRLRQERTDRHQHLVRKLAMAIGGPLRENPAAFDLLSSHAEEYCVIWEVKTIDGDAASQTRSAVSQLLYYQYFDVAPVSDCDDTAMVVAFEKDIGEELPAFLEHLRIGAVIIEGTGSGLTATNSTGAAILSRIRSS